MRYEALDIVAHSIHSVLWAGDLVGRMGGEEFAVYLSDMDRQQTDAIAEGIRHSVYLANFAPDGRRLTLSVSIGEAVFEAPARFAELFRIADRHLYSGEKSGRNRAADKPQPILCQSV
ncbi:MAG: diguanylate cyclase [Candidatus Devosia symbiotica]|nr:diguanylate cyclase [Candidatus Devosia symbiotica]